MLDLYTRVKLKSNGATGIIVNIEIKNNNKYYCIEYDEKYQYLDEDMGIVYVTEQEIDI